MQSTHVHSSRSGAKPPVSEFIKLFAPIMLLFLVVGLSIISYRIESRIRSLIDEDSVRLHHISGFIGAYMSSAFNHLRSISGEATTQRALNSSDPAAFGSLENSLLTLAQRNPVYDQVRWIDETGFEKIRISRGQDVPFVEPRKNLQDKSRRYYFITANSLQPRELYASKIDLNVEHGEIETPLKPEMRIATPVMDANGRRRGIIIINILMAPVFNSVQYLEQAGETGNYMLINQQGEIIYGSIQAPEKQKSNQPSTSFSKVYPAIWNDISMSESGHLELEYGLWTWKKISSFENLIGSNPYNNGIKSGFEKKIEGDFSLIFVVQRPLGYLLDMRRDIRVSTLAGVLVALVAYGVSQYFFLSGNFRARRAELDAAYARVHAESMTRLKEHEERFRRLVESSSIGQLVVDGAGKIEISNATVEQMLGYEKDELFGAPVEKLLPGDKQQAHIAFRENFMRKPQPRKMGEGRELEALRKDGTKIPVEIGLNPYTDKNRELVLVNVIDLSNRKTSG